MSNIKTERLSWKDIREITKEIREKYLPNLNQIPIPIEYIIEFKYKLDIVPKIGLKSETDIEGLLLSDLKTIIIDNSSYFDDRFQKRMRFTLAHELGHLVLHSEQIKQMKFQSCEEWLNYKEKIDEDDLDWFEKQAKEFAGSLLVPGLKLDELINENKDMIEEYLKKSDREDANEGAIIGISRKLSDKFNVSSEVIRYRLRKEGIWNKYGFNNF